MDTLFDALRINNKQNLLRASMEALCDALQNNDKQNPSRISRISWSLRALRTHCVASLFESFWRDWRSW